MLSVTVQNTGDREGVETVQIYQNDSVSSVLTPVKRLIAFTQITLAAGESKVVEIRLNKDDFALINSKCEKVVEPGEFTVFAGHSSKDEDLISIKINL